MSTASAAVTGDIEETGRLLSSVGGSGEVGAVGRPDPRVLFGRSLEWIQGETLRKRAFRAIVVKEMQGTVTKVLMKRRELFGSLS